MNSSHLRPAWQTPVQWPHVAAQALAGYRPALQIERLLKAAIVFAMLALTVLDRFGLRLSADFSIPPALMAMYVLIAAMVLGGAAELNPRAALAYLAMALVAALSFLVNASFEPRPYASITSLLLLWVLYVPFAVSLAPHAVPGPGLWRWAVGLYIAFSVFLALAGSAQFFAQFVLRTPWLFDYTPLIPEAVRASGGWNTVYPVGDWIKSNGFFLREPSMFSTAMGFALLCELYLAKRIWVIAILILGLLLSYSGSGLLCVAIAMLFPLGRGSLPRLAACTAVGALVFFLLDDALSLSHTLAQADEINHKMSSAYCRFIYPGAAAWQNLDANVWSSVLGNGPGAMPRMGGTCPDGHQTTYGKLLFEYGVAGTLACGVLILGALKRSAAPVSIRVAVGVAWLLLGGNLVASEMLLFLYVISAMWPEGIASHQPSPGA